MRAAAAAKIAEEEERLKNHLSVPLFFSLPFLLFSSPFTEYYE
jgi:hypothetical protein